MRFRLAIVLFSFAVAIAGLPQTSRADSMAATAALNVRTGPGLDYPIADTLFSGERVMVGACQANWCHVTHSGPDGWVYQPYLVPGITTTTIQVSSNTLGANYVAGATANDPQISVNVDLPAPRPCRWRAVC